MRVPTRCDHDRADRVGDAPSRAGQLLGAASKGKAMEQEVAQTLQGTWSSDANVRIQAELRLTELQKNPGEPAQRRFE